MIVLETWCHCLQSSLLLGAASLPPSTTIVILAESTRVVPKPALLGTICSGLTNPELASGVVLTFIAAHSIQFRIIVSTDEDKCRLRSTQLPEAGIAFVAQISSSACFLL